VQTARLSKADVAEAADVAEVNCVCSCGSRGSYSTTCVAEEAGVPESTVTGVPEAAGPAEAAGVPESIGLAEAAGVPESTSVAEVVLY